MPDIHHLAGSVDSYMSIYIYARRLCSSTELTRSFGHAYIVPLSSLTLRAAQLTYTHNCRLGISHIQPPSPMQLQEDPQQQTQRYGRPRSSSLASLPQRAAKATCGLIRRPPPRTWEQNPI